MPEAITPYNFVPLPFEVLAAEEHAWPDNEKRPYPQADRYHADLHTGWFDIELTALTPIYTRAARKPGGPQQPPEFFQRPDGTYAIPGSGLRGMIRSLFEVMTRSSMEFVSDRQLFFRNFAEVGRTNLRQLYSTRFGDKSRLRAGVLVEENGALVLRVSRVAVNGFVVTRATNLNQSWTRRGRNEFKPPRAVRVEISGATHRMIGASIADVVSDGPPIGWLIVPGMDVPRRDGTQRTWFQVILDPEGGEFEDLTVSSKVYDDYLAWGESAHGKRFGTDKAPRKLVVGEPAFALLDTDGKVSTIGANMMMALRYETSISTVAARGRDKPLPDTDMAQSVFGRVRDGKKDEKSDQIRGRVFFENAVCTSKGEVRLVPTSTDKALLLGPKPTAFQVYLKQPSPQSLVHWDSKNAEVAGHKRYWHRSSDAAVEAMRDSTLGEELKSGERRPPSDDLLAKLEPLRAGTTFTGRVRFENLNSVELGAIYASIQLPDGLAHKFGMGKSFGLGSVRARVSRTALYDMAKRYESLSADAGLIDDGDVVSRLQAGYSAFVNKLSPGSASLWSDDRMKTLAAMLTWDGRPPDNLTEQVGFDDQWRYRWTLPEPRQLATLQLVADVFPVKRSTTSSPATKETAPSGAARRPQADVSTPPRADKAWRPQDPLGDAPKQGYRQGEKVTVRIIKEVGFGRMEVELPDGSRAVAEQMYSAVVGETKRVKVMQVGGDGKVKRLAP